MLLQQLVWKEKMGKQYKQGEKIPDGIRPVYYVTLYGNVIRTVDLTGEMRFPELEDTKMMYVSFG